MPANWPYFLHLVVVLGSCTAAVIFGGWRERIGAVSIISISVAGSVIATRWPQTAFWPVLGLDILCLLAFIRLCWKSPHPWPIWASLFQTLSLMCGVAGQTHTPSWALSSALILSGYGIVLALLSGTFAAIRRKIAAKLSESKK